MAITLCLSLTDSRALGVLEARATQGLYGGDLDAGIQFSHRMIYPCQLGLIVPFMFGALPPGHSSERVLETMIVTRMTAAIWIHLLRSRAAVQPRSDDGSATRTRRSKGP